MAFSPFPFRRSLTMSEENFLADNPAEPAAQVSTAAEAAQPEEPEEPHPGNRNHVPSSELEQEENRPLIKFEEERNTNFENRKRARSEISEEIAKALNFYESPDKEIIPFAETLTNKEHVTKRFIDKFTQTFFKYMKNLSNRRVMEIIKQNIDHDDESLIFFCSENNLPFTFN